MIVRVHRVEEPLTAKRVESLTSATARKKIGEGKRKRYADGGALYLVVTPGGSSWLYRYASPGHKAARELGLGSTAFITLDQAREAARTAAALRKQGIDPIQQRRTVEAAMVSERKKDKTFEAAATEFIAEITPTLKNEKHIAQWSSTMKTYAFPVIGELQVRAVDRTHILTILRPIWLTKMETADRVRARIERILDWAVAHDHRPEGPNPAALKAVKAGLPPRPKNDEEQHHEAIEVEALPKFMRELRKEKTTTRLALEFAIVTAARTGEVLAATWSQIDLKGRLWTIQGEDMKSGRTHIVPLSRRAVEILKAVKPAKPDPAAYVFPGQSGGQLSNMVFTEHLRRTGYTGPNGKAITTHGMRSAFRDWAGDSPKNYEREMIEFALAHKVRSKTERAYRRRTAVEARRRLMQDWADYCATT